MVSFIEWGEGWVGELSSFSLEGFAWSKGVDWLSTQGSSKWTVEESRSKLAGMRKPHL